MKSAPHHKAKTWWDRELIDASLAAIELSHETLRRTENFVRSSRFLILAEELPSKAANEAS